MTSDSPDRQDEKSETSSSSSSCHEHCTFAVTGAVPTFQAIYVCHECHDAGGGGTGTGTGTGAGAGATTEEQQDTNNNDQPLCICQACADTCHEHHEDVEYIGMGPCYCDCQSNDHCTIYQESIQKAQEMGMVWQPEEWLQKQTQEEAAAAAAAAATCGTQAALTYIQDVYTIPSLLEPILGPTRRNEDGTTAETTTTTTTKTTTITGSDQLVEAACALVQHTKETLWVDASMQQPPHNPLHPLEQLAWAIFQRHVQHYQLQPTKFAGAEWWVQVKETTATTANQNQKKQAIDLHYDKDEALAEQFGIGSFCKLSTVTYLTPSYPASPTIVFDHRYDQGEEQVMSTMLVSRPAMAKHLVFDGRLLHGAPLHESLRPAAPSATTTITTTTAAAATTDDNDNDSNGNHKQQKQQQDSPSGMLRVTFLVNLWMDRQPASVLPLDDVVRQQLPGIATTTTTTIANLERNNNDDDDDMSTLLMTPRGMHKATISNEEELPPDLRHRMELPFVCKGITWEDQDQDQDGLVVICFPPPHVEDTMLVTFGSGMQAYLDYRQEKEDPDNNSQDPSQYLESYV
jgi:hypothetical protein